MENQVRMSIHLDIAAQKIINQFVVHNEVIEGQLEAGIKKAFERFDFESAVEDATVSAIQKSIRESSSWDSLIKLVKQKADKIIQDHIDKQMEEIEKKFKS